VKLYGIQSTPSERSITSLKNRSSIGMSAGKSASTSTWENGAREKRLKELNSAIENKSHASARGFSLYGLETRQMGIFYFISNICRARLIARFSRR
jgi:hypothetical protein